MALERRGQKRKRTDDPWDASAGLRAAPADAELLAFGDLVTRRAETFAGMPGGDEVAREGLKVAKRLFEQALGDEATFLPRASALLSQLVDFGIQTRAKSRRRAQRARAPALQNPLLRPTPLAELFVDGMPDEQIWEQIDLRSGNVAGLVSLLASGGQETTIDQNDVEQMEVDEVDTEINGAHPGSDDDDDDDDDDDESDSEYDDGDSGESAAPGEDDDAELSDAEISHTNLNDSLRTTARSKRVALDELDDVPRIPERTSSRPGSAVDDDFFSLDAFLRESEQGEAEMRRSLRDTSGGGAESDEEADDDEIDLFEPIGGTLDAADREQDGEEANEDGSDLDETADIGYAQFFDPPPRRSPVKTLRTSLSSPKKARSEDDPRSSQRRVSFSDRVMVKPIAVRKGATSFSALAKQNGLNGALAALNGVDDEGDENGDDDDDDDDGDVVDHATAIDGDGDDASSSPGTSSADDSDVGAGDEIEAGLEADSGLEEEGSSEEEARLNGVDRGSTDEDDRVMASLRGDLLDDGDADSAVDLNGDGESRYQKRLRALRKQIAELEAENVAEKEWTMRGEASSKGRPLNSLLEEDLEFENVAKVVPEVTTEVTASLEEMIKKRILEDAYDDVVRRRPFDPATYLPSRLLDIAATQSDKSLAELYEDEFSTDRQRAEGKEVVHPADARLEKEHTEIERLYEELCGKLDALSNARFTPKAPHISISTVSNVPAISMETALPSSQSAGTLLAPEEVYSPAGRAAQDGAAKTELSPSEKKAARQRSRRHRAAQQKLVTSLSGAKKPLSASQQKADALKTLVGKRGVTVIGKASGKLPVKKGKAVQKAQGQVEKRGSAALKL